MYSRPNSSALASTIVLVVDDSRPMREIMKMILRGLGVGNVVTADSVEAAAAAIARAVPDLIFLDWCMQPEGGLDLVRRLRQSGESPCPFVPIIMCTGHTEPQHVATARDAGITEFLAKPVSVDAVARRIEEVILRPRRFVRAQRFFGPDRRRVSKEFAGGDRRAGRASA